jgi:Holliday junction resolvase YEN1
MFPLISLIGSKAPGEAEAELAYLNSIGAIDGILSDDVDAFLFGAKVIIRKWVLRLTSLRPLTYVDCSPSATLAGNKSHNNVNASGKQDGLHTTIYRAEEILEHPSIQLCQGGLILFALLSGGDYHMVGLKGCGRGTAHALARCGLGHKLLVAAKTLPLGELKSNFLPTWREELCRELRTNSHGYLGRRYPSLADRVSDDFPDVDVLLSYTNPLTTEIAARGRNREDISWNNDPSPADIAAACEQFFEWGYEDMMLHRFRKWLWSPLVCRMLRRTALNRNREGLSERYPENLADTPRARVAKQLTNLVLRDPRAPDQEDADEKLVLKIHAQRTHVSTDGLVEYRLEINPASLVRQCKQGVLGTRSKPEKDEEYAREDLAASSNPYEHLRVWMPASVVELAEPNLVTEWEDSKRRKLGKSPSKTRTKDVAVTNDSDDELLALFLRSPNSKDPKSAKHSTASTSQLNPVGEGETKETTYRGGSSQPAVPLPLSRRGEADSNGRLADMKYRFVASKPQRDMGPPQVETNVSHTEAALMPAIPHTSVRKRAASPLSKQISIPQVSIPEPTTLEVLLSISSLGAPLQSKDKVRPVQRQPFPDPSPKSCELTPVSPQDSSHVTSRSQENVVDIIEISSDSDTPSPPKKRRVAEISKEILGREASTSRRFIIDLT